MSVMRVAMRWMLACAAASISNYPWACLSATGFIDITQGGAQNSTEHYAVIFFARESPESTTPPYVYGLPGHAFVAWEHIVPGKQPDISAFGVYPVQGVPAFGPVPGSLLDEVQKARAAGAPPPPPTDTLMVMMDQSLYDQSMATKNKYPQNPTFQLAAQDCVSFTDTIAKSLGLVTPDRSSALLTRR